MENCLYRYEGYRGARAPIWNNGVSQCHGTGILLCKFPIVRRTPCGFWIRVNGKEKLCYKDSIRSYAYESKSLAFNSFRRRKIKQVAILANMLDKAKRTLAFTRRKREYPIDEVECG